MVNLLGIKERDQPFLLDALLSPSGLYGNAMLLVLSGCCQRAAQAARLQLLILPRPERECCCLSPPSKRLGVEAALSSEASEGENGSEDHFSLKKGFREEVLVPDGLVLSPSQNALMQHCSSEIPGHLCAKPYRRLIDSSPVTRDGDLT